MQIYLRALSLIFSLSLLNCSYLKAQDSLVVVRELEFSSEFEEQNYFDLLQNDEHAYEVLMSIHQRSDPAGIKMDKAMLDHEITRLKSLTKPKGKQTKYIKGIYNAVHDRFLKKYELKNYFNEVFKNGQYNCVSACALYALVFDDLGIDYIIKETPTHVYIVVDPGGEQFLVETTDPKGGFNNFGQNFKESFVKLLLESKLISASEYSNKDVNSLFQEYYFTDINLGLKELVAIQYSNDAIFQVEDEAYLEAIKSLRKSYLLYPNEKTEALLLFAISNVLSSQKYTSLKDIKLYAALTRFDTKTLKDDELYNEFIKVTSNVLSDAGNKKLYDEMFEVLSYEVKRPELLKEITFAYYYERGRILYNRANYDKSLPFLDSAYATKPNNIDVETLFLACFSQLVNDDTDYDAVIDQMEEVSKRHVNLNSNNNFGGIWLNAYLFAMGEAYRTKKYESGQSYKTKFEDLYKENRSYKVEKEFIGMAYSQLAVYYFKKGQYTNAKRVISKGLEYAPGNIELKNRRRMMN